MDTFVQTAKSYDPSTRCVSSVEISPCHLNLKFHNIPYFVVLGAQSKVYCDNANVAEGSSEGMRLKKAVEDLEKAFISSGFEGRFCTSHRDDMILLDLCFNGSQLPGLYHLDGKWNYQVRSEELRAWLVECNITESDLLKKVSAFEALQGIFTHTVLKYSQDKGLFCPEDR